MTISDKIRIYELSRDLNLDNKDILDAAQKLSISVKSHSSSISAEEAKKIKNLITKKNSDKEILSIKKPSIKKDNYKQNKENESSVISSMNGKPPKDNSNKKQLLMKPLNKPESQKITSNKPLAVFLGSSSALVFASLLGALTGGSISSFLPEVVLKSIASITFFIIGIRLFINSFTIEKEEKEEKENN